MKKTIVLLSLFVSFSALSQSPVLPDAPENLANDERRAFVVLHYWDNYDFENPSVFLEGDDVFGYFALLRDVPYAVSKESVSQILDRASKNNQIFSLFIDAYRTYLMNPESYFCDYERYLAVLEYVLANERILQSMKSVFSLEKEIIYANRVGDRASDFVVVDRNNNFIELYDIETDYVLLFFHNPNCSICVEKKEKLSHSKIVNGMIEDGKLTFFAVCPYDEYEKWNDSEYPERWLSGYDKDGRINREKLYYFVDSSSLYLLDREKRVLKKDIRLDLLEEYLFFSKNEK